MGMRELKEIWSDIANSIVDAKLESARAMAAAVTGAVMGMGGAAS